MPRTRTHRPITYRDRRSRVWYVSEVARFKVVSPAIDGPNVALVIRFEREGEELFARRIGGDDWRQRGALNRLFAEAEPAGPEAPVTAQVAEAVQPPPVATPAAPNDTDVRDAAERTLAPWEYEPQKAVLVAEPPTGDRWLHEIKLDGFRMGILVGGRGQAREVLIISRNGTDYTAAFPELVEAATELSAGAAMLDGEVVVLDERGRSSFQLLQQLGTSRRGLVFFAFDLLALDGEDLKPLPLAERKRRLETLIGQRAGIIRYTPHFDADGATVLANACRLGAEGIVSKCRTAPYRAGSRSDDWRKTKCVRRARSSSSAGSPSPKARARASGRSSSGTTRDVRCGSPGRSAPAAAGTTRSAASSAGCSSLSKSTPRRSTRRRPARLRSGPTGSSRGSWPRCSSPSGPATGGFGTRRYRASARTGDRQTSGVSARPTCRSDLKVVATMGAPTSSSQSSSG